MKTLSFVRSFFLLTLLMIAFTACEKFDLGPYQSGSQSYNHTGFDQLEVGDAFEFHVLQGSNFSILAQGDQRNLDDLDVYVSNGTLHARYHHNRSRHYKTKFDITMPSLHRVDFSGASSSTIDGFNNQDTDIEINLSGASECEASLQARKVSTDISGASDLVLNGLAKEINAEVSGASKLRAFNLPTQEANIKASGASSIQVKVSDLLKVNASGASKVRYVGSPQLDVDISGASQVQPD
jgi:ribosome-associated translation inhibitor RaiA